MLASAAIAVALLAASAWLGESSSVYLATCLVATVVAAAALPWTPQPTVRWPLGIAVVALFASGAIATRAQVRLARFAHAPSEVGDQAAEAQQVRLRQRVDAELVTLRAIAHAVKTLPREPAEAVHTIERILGDGDLRAAFVLHADTLVTWGGTLHAEPLHLNQSSGVVATPFGLTLYVVNDSGGSRTVAASLLYATSPADHLIRGIAQRIPSDEVAEGFDIGPPSAIVHAGDLQYMDKGRPLFTSRALVPSPGEVLYRLRERAHVRIGIALFVALLAFMVAMAGRDGGAASLIGGALVVLSSLAILPLSEFSTRSRLFDASVYFLPTGRAFTSNAAALAFTSATVLLLVLAAVRRVGSRLPRALGATLAAVAIVSGPFAVRALSRGISPPSEGVTRALWVIWTVPLCLTATSLLVLAHWAGRRSLGGRRGVPIAIGPALALFAAVIAQRVWQAPGQWPQWYSVLWALAVAAVVCGRTSHRALVACATVAALAASTVVWSSASRGRVELAERDVRGLAGPDSSAIGLSERLARSMQGDELPRTPQALLERYVTADLASSGYPVALISWTGEHPIAAFGARPFTPNFEAVATAATEAAARGIRVITSTRSGAYGVLVVAVPMRGGVMTILVAPRTRLIGSDAYSRWYGLATYESGEPPYTVQVIGDSMHTHEAVRWRRQDNVLHGDWPLPGPNGEVRAHAEVDLRGLESLLPRGGLLVLVNLFVVSLVWFVGALADGRAARWLSVRRRRLRSYRARLSVALFLFFLVPAAAFAVWSWQQLFDDAQASRRLLVTETMRAFAGDPAHDPNALKLESVRLDTKLLVYRSGVLAAASDSLFAALAPMGQLLRPDVALALDVAGEASATRAEQIEGATGMLGYRVLPASNGALVLAAPARVDDFLLDRRRRDLGVLVLFATALGAAAALWLSALAARQLARPIGALRSAARAVARGESELPLDANAVSEFLPVFTAFQAMAHDLGESRSALVEAQRRTDAVLRTVASGVIAVDEAGRVILANPRAEVLLGDVPGAGEPVARLGTSAVAMRVAGFLRGGHDGDGFELERDGRTLRGQLTRLQRGGAVLTIDDVTELARAQRVLAWGEMARQVAHEIKNPLTPIRLGVQHLRRAWGRPDFESVLEQNVSRILTEIDRLDEIARAFSRYGSVREERSPAEPTDVAAIVHDVVELERLGESTVSWSARVSADVPFALARADELREVLLNLFENARLADARSVTATVSALQVSEGITRVQIEVVDDGSGIAAAVLPKIFEPHFSTRTSGSGLGLAITRRLVEGWGGDVTIESTVELGTTVRITLRAT